MSSSWPFCSDPCSGAITDHQLDNNHGQKSSNSNQNNHALEHRACCLPESCLQNRKHKRGQLTSKASTWMAPSHLAAISAEPGPLNTLTAEFLIGCFLGAENAFCSSISWKLTWVRFCPDGVPPFILVLSRRTPPSQPSSRYRCTSKGCNTLSWCSFPPPSTVCVSFCPVWSFSLQSCLRLININHVTDSILCCLEIASTRETNPLLFNLVSGELLGQRQEAGQLFASISQAWPLAQLMLFYLKLPELVLHNPPWPQQSCLRDFLSEWPFMCYSPSSKFSSSMPPQYNAVRSFTGAGPVRSCHLNCLRWAQVLLLLLLFKAPRSCLRDFKFEDHGHRK